MKKLLAIIISLSIIVTCVVASFAAGADTLDAYSGDSWNVLYRSFNHTKVYSRSVTWTDSTMSNSVSSSGSHFYYYTTPGDIDLKGSYFEIKGVSMSKGTYDLSTTVRSDMTLISLEFYDSQGTLIGSADTIDTATRTTTGTITFDTDVTGMTIKAIAQSSSTNGTRYRLGGSEIKFVEVSDAEYTSRNFDATRAYAGATSTTTSATTATATFATADHENCSIGANAQHTAHGVRGLNVDDYVYYKFTDVPAGTYNITDYYYDVSSGAAKWDVYVGNSVEALTKVNGIDTCGSNAVKTLATENVTVDTTGILIYAVKFTSGTANDCRTVHCCFDLEQTSATGEPLETTSTAKVEETTTTTTTTTTTPKPAVSYFTPADVANMDNWVKGWYNNSNGIYNEIYTNNSRACVGKIVKVEEGATYKFTISGKSGLNIVLRTYDSTGAFKGTANLSNGAYTVGTGVGYVSITMYDLSNLIDYITDGTVTVSMTAEGEEESSSTQKPEEPSSSTPAGDDIVYTNQSTWVDGQKYLLVMPSCLTEGYMGKGILVTNGVVASTYTGTDTVASLKFADYDCSSVNTKKECNALLSFTTKQDLSQYYFTAVKVDDTYFAFKTSDGKYLCAGPQEGKNSATWNKTYFSDTIVDDAMFTGEYNTGVTGSADSNLGNNAFKVTSKTGYHFRTLNNGNIVCKADADYYQGFVGFYTTGKTVEQTPSVNISMKFGASIRLNAVNGIRFYSQVDSAKISSLIADGYTVEMGTLIAPADLLEDSELTFESGVSCLDVKYTAKDKDGNFIYYEDNDTFVGSIVEIKESSTSWSLTSGNVTRKFVGRGYVKITKDGKTTINYADYANNEISNNSRSLKVVAEAYKADPNSNYTSLNSNFKELVDKWAAAVK